MSELEAKRYLTKLGVPIILMMTVDATVKNYKNVKRLNISVFFLLFCSLRIIYTLFYSLFYQKRYGKND